MQPGRFITFEGIDGAGKSTQLQQLSDHLTQAGICVVKTREPGGTPVGELLRDIVLNQAMSAQAETLIMFAIRAEHLRELIKPALAQGHWVVCDRFTDASYAYQCGGRGLAPAHIDTMVQWVHPGFAPDLTFLVDIDPKVAAARLARARAADRFESETLDFFSRVRNAYLERANQEPERFCVLDGSANSQDIHQRICTRIAKWL
ncbi:MAG TPA: dTMP kinase [Burkholderiaceae bacterium]|nr:dTMP kinase [Burkholderiaceae bacterium]